MADTLEFQNRFAKLYPVQAKAFANAKSDEEMFALQEKFVNEAKKRLIEEIENSDLKNNVNYAALMDTDETIAVAITENLYDTLIHSRGGAIESEIVKLFDALERIKNMGTQDAEMLTYSLLNAGLAAIGIAMVTNLVINLLAGIGLAEAIYTVAVTLSMSVIGAIVDIIVLCMIPIIYFMVKPAACIFLVINELDVDLIIDSDEVIHGKLNVKTKTIPASMKILHTMRSGGLWSVQKRDAALIGSQYAVVLKQQKTKYGTQQPDQTKFAIAVECPLAQGSNSCAVGINKSLEFIGNEVDNVRRQEATSDENGYKMEMHCHSGSGSLAYYICRIYKK